VEKKKTPAQRALAQRWSMVLSMAAGFYRLSPDVGEDFRRYMDVAVAAAIASWANGRSEPFPNGNRSG
jgi:hypothetical protein